MLVSFIEITFLQVTDLSDGCGSKFNVIIVSPSFEGVGLLDRQRKLNDIVKVYQDSIHALSWKAWTPAQYEKRKAEGKVDA